MLSCGFWWIVCDLNSVMIEVVKPAGFDYVCLSMSDLVRIAEFLSVKIVVVFDKMKLCSYNFFSDFLCFNVDLIM